MIPRPAQYLLRFDDLCPTMSRQRWERFLPLIQEFGVRPILGVVPNNRDRSLDRSVPHPEFWDEMRALEAAGAAIALHGYRHLCNSHGVSLLPLHRKSEFAGVAEETQRQWIHSGLEILRGEGLSPRLWIAPNHGFDRKTLRALRAEGISVLSDGFARVPFVRGGVTWIPQQLWEPEEKSKGLWTICIHSNTARSAQVDQIRVFLRRHGAQLTSVDRVMAEFPPTELSPSEHLHEKLALWRAQSSRAKKRLLRRVRKSLAE
jgi:predicted deacetylase